MELQLVGLNNGTNEAPPRPGFTKNNQFEIVACKFRWAPRWQSPGQGSQEPKSTQAPISEEVVHFSLNCQLNPMPYLTPHSLGVVGRAEQFGADIAGHNDHCT